MSLFHEEEEKCAICGQTSKYNVLMSTNTFGGPDLDLRPPEMKRSTMDLWVHECPHCGYVSESVSDVRDIDMEWLRSAEYRTCERIRFKSDLAKQFYRFHMICIKSHNEEDAFYALLHAAWACDDAKDRKRAKSCREMAIPLLGRLIGSGESEESTTLNVMRADLMRRAGQFRRVIEEYSDMQLEDHLLNRIIQFEVKRSRKRDDRCYTVSDVQKE